MNTLNLNHLYYFWLAANEGSIRKAAAKIHLTQPTLSDQIRTLEKRLGKNLFERKNNRLHLTKAGTKVLEHCSKMFHEGEKILLDIENDSETSLHIKVGILPEISKHLLCDLLLPVVSISDSFLSITEAEYKYLLKDLDKGELDLIVTTDRDDKLPSIFKQKKLQDNNFVAVCNRRSRRKEKFPKLLESIPYISFTSESHLHTQIEDYFNKSKIKVKRMCEVDDVNLMKFFAIKSNAFAILPRTSVEEEIGKGDLVILGEIPSTNSSVTLVYKDLEQNKKLLKTIQI